MKKGCAYLMYLAKLFGYFFVSAQGMMGAIAPTRKKNMSALWGTQQVSNIGTQVVLLTIRLLR